MVAEHRPKFFTTLMKKSFENIVGRGKNTSKQHFLLFLTMFPGISKVENTILDIFSSFSAYDLTVVLPNISLCGKVTLSTMMKSWPQPDLTLYLTTKF